MKFKLHSLVAALSVAAAFTAAPAWAENVKIAFMDPMSGPFGGVGEHFRNVFEVYAEKANKEKWAGENTFEIVGFDNKGSVQESLILLKTIIDQGYRYLAQGNSSAVAMALVDAINKHNERNPGKEIVLLDYSNSDPDLTNSKCSFWHFQTALNLPMKLEAMTTYMAKEKGIKKVYMINQNYSMGQQSSKMIRNYLKNKRPDIQIVGDDLHPIGVVKDFSPYIAKMKASGADTIMTNNWGADYALLVKAAKDSDLQVNFYTLFSAANGGPLAMGSAWAGRVRSISGWEPNAASFTGKSVIDTVKARFKDDNHYYYVVDVYNAMMLLASGIKNAKTTDPTKVAMAMEGMKYAGMNGEPVEMRKMDHQLQSPLWLNEWSKADGKTVRYDQENTGHGWKPIQKIDAYVASQPSSCQMKRP